VIGHCRKQNRQYEVISDQQAFQSVQFAKFASKLPRRFKLGIQIKHPVLGNDTNIVLSGRIVSAIEIFNVCWKQISQRTPVCMMGMW
jgi:hypothetical protein